MDTFKDLYGTDDPRLGHIIVNGDDGDVVLLGFPYDEGVRRNGGRIGAEKGPAVVRQFLSKMGPIVNMENGIDLRTIKITDAGDISPGLELESAHTLLTQKVSQIIKTGGIPFVIGGGNDQSYPNARGLLENLSSENAGVGVINIDAHLDVRPLKDGKVHSGSPFRQLLEDPTFVSQNGKFYEFASQGNQCSAEHWNYVLSKNNTKIVPLGELQTHGANTKFDDLLNELGNNVFVSFDLDSVSSVHAPGVSCPANIGISANEAVKICYSAGAHSKVRLFDLSEFNPVYDDYITARLVVLMFYNFLLGYADRKQKKK